MRVGAALYEEFAYGAGRQLPLRHLRRLSGADRDGSAGRRSSCIIETPSPFTPLGAKGVGEGNCMSTPVCIANAVADALGVADIDLPLTPAKLAAHLHGAEEPASIGDRRRHGCKAEAAATCTAAVRLMRAGEPEAVWAMLLDPKTLAALVPGCHGVDESSDTHFRADVDARRRPGHAAATRPTSTLSDLDPPQRGDADRHRRRRARRRRRHRPHHA